MTKTVLATLLATSATALAAVATSSVTPAPERAPDATPTTTEHSASDAATRDELERLRRVVESQRHERAALETRLRDEFEQRLARLEHGVATAIGAQPPEPTQAELRQYAQPAESAGSIESVVEHYEDVLLAAPLDAAVRAEFEATLEGHAEAFVLNGSKLVDLYCTSDHCRIEYAHDDFDAQYRIADNLALMLPAGATSTIVADENEAWTIAYVELPTDTP